MKDKRVEQILEEMKKSNLKGKISTTKVETIKWDLEENVSLEIVPKGHGGDDLIIIRYIDPRGNTNTTYDDLNTDTNEELLKIIKEYNTSEIEIYEKKKLFGRKDYEIVFIEKSNEDDCKLRDKSKSKEYWQNKISESKTMIKELEEKLKNVKPERIHISKQYIELKRFELLISMYSAGEDLNSCKDVYIKNINNIAECKDSMESYVDLIWYISLGVLFNIASKEIDILEKMILPKYKEDMLVCYFMKYLKKNYKSGKTYFMKNPYELLDDLINDRLDNISDFIREYLKKWYKAHNQLYWYDSNKKDSNLYFGYWSFELAAIIKIKAINTSSLKELEYYPFDLINF